MKEMLFVQLLVIGIIGSLLEGCAQTPAANSAPAAGNSFAIFALSRGAGVPKPTRDALQKVQALLKQAKERGENVQITQERIGIEGETRVCATFADADVAQKMLQRVRELVKGTELINLVIEPCSGKSDR